MKFNLSYKLALAVIFLSLFHMAADLRFGCVILLPLFLSIFSHHPPIFMGILLLSGFCEDVFFHKWFGITPFLYIVFKSFYEHVVLDLLKLENFHILWLSFIFTIFAYEGLQFYFFTVQYAQVPYHLKDSMGSVLTILLFPLIFKKFFTATRIIHGP